MKIETPEFFSLINDDCVTIMETIESDTVDLLLTDPPYNLGQFMHSRDTNLGALRKNHFVATNWDNLEYEKWEICIDKFFEESARILRPGSSAIIFVSLMKIETMIRLAEKHGFYYKTTGIWHKTNPMPRNMNLHFINSTEGWLYFVIGSKTGTFNNRGIVYHDFYETSVTNKKESEYGRHPTQKPLKLLRHFVTLLTNVNDVVLDPFMGVGSSGVAAIDLNRRFLGIEIDDSYYEIATKRMQIFQEKRKML